MVSSLFFQPLHFFINKSFNQALREKYVKYCCDNDRENLKKSRTKIIKFKYDTWFDYHIIVKEIIYKSFRVTVFWNKLDHSEDYLFPAWKYGGRGTIYWR